MLTPEKAISQTQRKSAELPVEERMLPDQELVYALHLSLASVVQHHDERYRRQAGGAKKANERSEEAKELLTLLEPFLQPPLAPAEGGAPADDHASVSSEPAEPLPRSCNLSQEQFHKLAQTVHTLADRGGIAGMPVGRLRSGSIANQSRYADDLLKVVDHPLFAPSVYSRQAHNAMEIKALQHLLAESERKLAQMEELLAKKEAHYRTILTGSAERLTQGHRNEEALVAIVRLLDRARQTVVEHQDEETAANTALGKTMDTLSSADVTRAAQEAAALAARRSGSPLHHQADNVTTTVVAATRPAP